MQLGNAENARNIYDAADGPVKKQLGYMLGRHGLYLEEEAESLQEIMGNT